VDRARLTQCQRDAANGRYAEALVGFIADLAPRYDDVRSQLRDDANKLRDRLMVAGHPRTADIIAQLALGLREFLRFAASIGAISRAQAESLWRRAGQALIAVSGAQRDKQVSENPVQRFIELLRAVFASGRGHVAGVAGSSPGASAWGWRRDGDSLRAQGACVGWLDGADLYLEPEAAYAAVQSFARESGDSLAVTSRTLHKRLREQGLLESVDTERDRLTVRRTLGEARRDVLHLRAETIYPPEPSQPSQSSPAPVDPGLPPLFPEQSGEAVPGSDTDTDKSRAA